MTSKKVPEIVKRNFIYRKVWNDVYTRDQNVIFLFIGDVGKGKSTAAMRVAEDLDEDFSLERVCFSTTELFDLIQLGDSKGKLRAGSAIVFDEAAGSEDAADSRNSLSKSNKILSFFSTISRAKRYIIIYVAPFFSQFDKRIRSIGITGIFLLTRIDRELKRGIANFYWSYSLPLRDKTLIPHPRLKDMKTKETFLIDQVSIPLPSAFLIKEYKKKKNYFIDGKIADWRKQLVSIKEKRFSRTNSFKQHFELVKSDVASFMDEHGKISKGELRLRLGMDDRGAATLKRLVDKKITQGTL